MPAGRHKTVKNEFLKFQTYGHKSYVYEKRNTKKPDKSNIYYVGRKCSGKILIDIKPKGLTASPALYKYETK